MGITEDWHELMFSLQCLTKGSAKRQFRQSIKYSFGGLCAYCRCRKATTIDHFKPKSKGGSSLRSNLVPVPVTHVTTTKVVKIGYPGIKGKSFTTELPKNALKNGSVTNG